MSSSTTQPSNVLAERRQRRGRHVARLQPGFWHCPNCVVVVATEARERHVCPAASPNISSSAPFSNTPVDQFFLSYPSFQYDRSLPPSESFNRLRRHQRWRRASPESDKAWNQYQKALKEEYQLWYGAEDDLALGMFSAERSGSSRCLQQLRSVRGKEYSGCVQDPENNVGTPKAVRCRHVNLVDLVEWARNGGESGGKKVRIFHSVKELSQYSKETHKIFRNDLDEDAEEGGVVLRHLLRRLFSKRLSPG